MSQAARNSPSDPDRPELGQPQPDPDNMPVPTPKDARAWLEQGRYEDVLRACRQAEEAAVAQEEAFGPARRALYGALRLDAREALGKHIEELSKAGDAAGAARLLGLLLREDPSAADSCHLRLEVDRPSPGPVSSEPGMRRSGVFGGAAPTARIVVDEIGELLVIAASQLVLGAGGLGTTAQLGAELPESLLLERRTSLSGGDRWRARALAGSGVVVDGEPLAAAGVHLSHGSRIGMGAGEPDVRGGRGRDAYSLHVRASDPGSSSLLLELGRGFHCAGVRAVLLLSEGPGGRVTLGRGPTHLLQAQSLKATAGIELAGDRLQLDCDSKIRVVRVDNCEVDSSGDSALSLPWPLAGRCDLEILRGAPPFWMSLQGPNEGGR